MITHYEVLGVKEDATGKEIKEAHLKLVLCLHPDKNVGVNDMVHQLVLERFLEAQDAYSTLSDSAKRKEYDAALAALRSEGEYYTPDASKPPVERKEPARCDKCQKVVGERVHSFCEVCLKKIAALEKEVEARRQFGVTACKLCGCKPLSRSPVSGVCLRCWQKIENEVQKIENEAKREDTDILGPLVGWSFYSLSIWLSAIGHWKGIFFLMLALGVYVRRWGVRARDPDRWGGFIWWSCYFVSVWLSATGRWEAVFVVWLALCGLDLLRKVMS